MPEQPFAAEPAGPLAPAAPEMASPPSTAGAAPPPTPPNPYADREALLRLFERCKREAFDARSALERGWERSILYVLGRQWLHYHPRRGQWIDRRLAKWIPRPVTNKTRETVQTLRSVFVAVDLGVVVRPNGQDPANVTAAAVADELEPLIAEEHHIKSAFYEGDFWLITCGNMFMHTWWDPDVPGLETLVPLGVCPLCGYVAEEAHDPQNETICPQCGQAPLEPSPDESQTVLMPGGVGRTDIVSPFEVGMPSGYARFDDLPYLVRKRWRDKSYYEDQFPDLAKGLTFATTPSDRSLQIMQAVSTQVDLGMSGSQGGAYAGSTAPTEMEGIVEYELWYKPNRQYPDGLLLRVVGDDHPQIVDDPKGAFPGPLPYRDSQDRPLFPWGHAGYDPVGGRIWAQGALEPLIPLQDAINRLDSLIELIVNRTANPVWLEPKGAEVERLTGEPGLVVKYTTLVDGQGKPERVAGEDIPGSLFQLREQKMKDFEELAGTFDVIKGAKPTGVSAFSALQLLVERSQSRFAAVFASRGDLYRRWYTLALELERKFGPDERVKALLRPNRTWSFRRFEQAQLSGAVTILVEDGATTPKTSLGKRAAIEQLNNLGLLNPSDPDLQFAVLTEFGLPKLMPSLNAHVQKALQLYDGFEQWAREGGADFATMPLVYHTWYRADIHLNEFDKWANTDRVADLLAERPDLVTLLEQYRAQLQMVAFPPMPVEPGAEGGGGAGAAQALSSSNRESAGLEGVPQGQSEQIQGRGPE